MNANTKLTRVEKQELKQLKADNKHVLIMNNEKTTIVFVEGVSTVEFSLSVMAPTEQKFRRKVGEFYAMCRFTDGYTVKMDHYDFYSMIDNMGLTEPM